MVAAWERGDIDGGFVWDPALGRMKEKGRVLITSGDLSNWGKATFDAMVARKGFVEKNPDFTCNWVKMVSAADADYRSNQKAYGPGTENSMAIAKAVSGQADQVGGVLALYDYPTLEEQVSGTWLGGGVQNALMAASEFLKAQGKLDSVLDSYKDSATPKYAQMVLDGKC
jgi:taurine transport system substrate-binding protein